MVHKEETNFNSMLEALSFLVKDEAEAIDGYEKVLAMPDLKPEDRVKLEKIRNAEIDHVHDLSALYRTYSNIEVVGTDSVKRNSEVKDYAARGSFNSVDELKSYYKGSQFLTEGDYVTVILKGGAELVYSVLSGGRVAFIRGRN